MSAAGLGYVTRLSASTLRRLVAELDLEKQLELGDRQKLMEITHQSKRYVIAGGQWRPQRDQERRQSRLDKAEAELKRLAAVKRKKVDVQKLASQVGRTLQRLKAHKYFTCHIDHVRLCFMAYWLSARLGGQWRAKGETEEVPRVLRHLQTIRLGLLQMGKAVHRTVMTEVPKNLNKQLQKLGLAALFAAPPHR